MKNPTFYISTEFYRLLNGQLSYNSTAVPVYNLETVPTENDGLYVVFQNPYIIQGKTKDSFMPVVNFQLDVINLLGGSEVTNKKVESVVNQVLGFVIPTPTTTGILSNSDFKVIRTELSASRDFSNRNSTNFLVRKVLTFEIYLKQL